MTDLTKDEIVKMAREAGYRADAKMHDHDYDLFLNFYTLCRAPLVAENAALKQAHEINADTLDAMQVEIDDWKARALKAEQVGAEVERLKKMSVANIMVRIVPGYDGGGEEIYAKSVEEVNAVMSDLSQRLDDVETDRDDWKARAEAAGAELARVRAVPSIKQFTGAIHAGQKQRSGESNKGTSQIPWAHTVGACAEVRNGANEHLQHRAGKTDAERSDHQCNSGCSGVSSGGAVCSQVTPPQPAAQEQTSAVPVVEMMVDALSRNRIMAADSDGNYTREVTPRVITAALTAGQQYLKENGK